MTASRQDSAISMDKALAFVTCKVLHFNGQPPINVKNINAYKEIKQSLSNVPLYLPILICTYLNNYRLKYTPFYGTQ